MILHRFARAASPFICAAMILGLSSPVDATVIGKYTVGNWIEQQGGLYFNDIVSISGTYTLGTSVSDRTSNMDVVENYGSSDYTYHLSGPYDGLGWGPVPSQLPVFTFPGFPLPPPQFARLSILGNTLRPNMFGATFADGIYVRTGYVTITQVIATPEPLAITLLLGSCGCLAWARPRSRTPAANGR